MTIKTEFNVGDTVYLANGMEIVETQIEDILVVVGETSTRLEYKTRMFSDRQKGNVLFASKEDLKDDLIEKIKAM